MSRRRARVLFLISLCSLAGLLAVPRATAAPRAKPGPWIGSSIVVTRFGEVRGYQDAQNTWVWVAIPFARPPVGALRWRAPQDPVPWDGVRGPRTFNGGCTQVSPIIAGNIIGSEDCLYLNVWRPRSLETGLPVYVWIHGGSNATGSATMVPDYYGTGIAGRSHMVFVSLNYRLGPLGWFTHPALRSKVSPLDASGNYGTLDIIKALSWIRDNIAAFGGDPRNVTVTGESAGGLNVLSLLIAPPAKGLFRQAMSESGAAITHGMGEADALSRRILDQLLLVDGKAKSREAAAVVATAMHPEQTRTYLLSKSDQEILRSFQAVTMGASDNPSILRDGVVIPREGFNVFSTGNYPNKVPLIIGSNKEEMKLFLYLGREISWKSDLYSAVARYGSDRWKATGVDEIARRLARHPDQPPVFVYQFCWGAPDKNGTNVLPGDWGRMLGAFHSLEVPFFLGTETLEGLLQVFLFSAQNEKGRKALSKAMMAYVASFTARGDPNPPGGILPAWTRWLNKPGAKKCIIFDAKGELAMISMTSDELTGAGVLAALRAELHEPLRTRTLQYLRMSRLPARIP
jgi:para-nitrobenzyl esterase